MDSQSNKQHPIFDMPIEIFTIIVTNDFETFRAAIRAPGIAKLTTHKYCQRIAKDKFIDIKKFEAYTAYFVNGTSHRVDGPAIEFNNGSKLWYRQGIIHRDGGPAVEYANGDKDWYINGKLHREDGPAVEYISGNKEWWINGNRVFRWL